MNASEDRIIMQVAWGDRNTGRKIHGENTEENTNSICMCWNKTHPKHRPVNRKEKPEKELGWTYKIYKTPQAGSFSRCSKPCYCVNFRLRIVLLGSWWGRTGKCWMPLSPAPAGGVCTDSCVTQCKLIYIIVPPPHHLGVVFLLETSPRWLSAKFHILQGPGRYHRDISGEAQP